MMGQKSEALYLLVMSQLLLEGVNALLHHRKNLRVGTQLLTILERNVLGTGIFL